MGSAASAFDAAAYLVDAYQGEVFGEAFFAQLAEIETDSDRAAEWRVLERLERHTKGELRAALERAGLDSTERREEIERGRTVGSAIAKLEDAERMQTLRTGLEGFVSRFREAVDSAPDEWKTLTRFVLDHELALVAWLDATAASSDDPVSAVVAFLTAHDAEPDAPFPDGMALTPLDDAFCRDPYAILADLQRRAPVHRDREFRRIVLTRHDDVQSVLRDSSFNVDVRKANSDNWRAEFPEADRDPSMLGLDDPEHKRLRNLVSGTFTPRAIEKWRETVEGVATELVGGIATAEAPEFDLVQALAAPLPAIAIARLLGVDPTRQADFKRWSEAAVEAGFNPRASEEQRAAADAARAALDAIFAEEIGKRRAQPADDLIGKMVTAEEEGDQLGEREIVTMCNLLLVAGNVTTSDLIGNGMKALLENPDQLAKLREEPDRMANAVEEMLRYDPPVTNSGRFAPRDLEIGGVPIKKGDSITTCLAAANRDPDIYPEPQRFDIERRDTHHQSFGGGAHLCLGAHLARLEAAAAMGALIGRFPGLSRSDRPFVYKRVPGFRGLAEYWVRKR